MICCAARWHKSSEQRGIFQLEMRNLNSDAFKEDDECKALEEDATLKDLTSSGPLALKMEELLKESQNDDEIIHMIDYCRKMIHMIDYCRLIIIMKKLNSAWLLT
jgi:hypothetical protein